MYFKQESLSQHYYDKKMQEFFKIWLGNMKMEEYEKRFLELFSYVDFIQEEKVNIQQFLNDLITFYKYKIYYDEPHTLKEFIWKDKFMYE